MEDSVRTLEPVGNFSVAGASLTPANGINAPLGPRHTVGDVGYGLVRALEEDWLYCKIFSCSLWTTGLKTYHRR
jgi:hypothetical protein